MVMMHFLFVELFSPATEQKGPPSKKNRRRDGPEKKARARTSICSTVQCYDLAIRRDSACFSSNAEMPACIRLSKKNPTVKIPKNPPLTSLHVLERTHDPLQHRHYHRNSCDRPLRVLHRPELCRCITQDTYVYVRICRPLPHCT